MKTVWSAHNIKCTNWFPFEIFFSLIFFFCIVWFLEIKTKMKTGRWKFAQRQWISFTYAAGIYPNSSTVKIEKTASSTAEHTLKALFTFRQKTVNAQCDICETVVCADCAVRLVEPNDVQRLMNNVNQRRSLFECWQMENMLFCAQFWIIVLLLLLSLCAMVKFRCSRFLIELRKR